MPFDAKEAPEAALLEASKAELLAKGRRGDDYKDQSKGRNRYFRRNRSRVAASVSDYNSIDMNAFFKKDVLTVGVRVHGETDDYMVRIRFGGILEELRKNVASNGDKFEFKAVVRSLTAVFGRGDVYEHCSCPDFKFTQDYWATKNGYNSGKPQLSNGKGIANPNDTKGGGCKHVMLVLANLDWLMKVASVINNYVKYAAQYMQKNYADYIFPAVFGRPYDKDVQLSLFNQTAKLRTSRDILDTANRIGRDSGRFKPGNQYRFKKKEEDPTEDNPLGLKFGKPQAEGKGEAR